jgi:acyl-CoA hydrolase
MMAHPSHLSSGALASALPPGGLTLVSSCSAESRLLSEEVAKAGEALEDMDFTGIFIPGLNAVNWDAGPRSRLTSFFRDPKIVRSGPIRFLPLCYQDMGRFLTQERPKALLVMVSPPDENGLCSFGTEVSFPAQLWPEVPVRIAHINPDMPRTPGDPGIPFAEFTAYFEGAEPLRTIAADMPDGPSEIIAAHVASQITNGSTLQMGIGKVPDAVLHALRNHRNLRLHSGLIGNGVLHLLNSGALAPGASAIGGVAIGSEALYAALGNEHFEFRPPNVTHNPALLAGTKTLVTINSAMEVDLFGQVYAESSSRGFVSGPGGASDYARGARASEGGLRIIALPSAAGAISRIVAPSAAHGPVSLSRFDTDLVVTEHGIADLRLADYGSRAAALIAIAAPEHREALEHAWHDVARAF